MENHFAANTAVSLVETTSNPSGFQLINSFRTNRVDSTDIVALAEQIKKADTFIKANACNKLQIIAEQMRFLEQQARKILHDAKEHHNLHHVPCNFVKKPGNVYHLYAKESGQELFCMLSPKEWGNSCPHKYLGAYKLEYDQSWTPAELVNAKEDEMHQLDKILSTSNTFSIKMG